MSISIKFLGASLALLLLLALALVSTGPAQAKEPELGKGVKVAEGGVGESGSSLLLTHRAAGEKAKLYVLRTVKTSLCGNTGAVAMLLVNGEPAAHGVITNSGSSIQAEAKPGDHIVVVVHAIPLSNDIICVRLGELSVELSAHDLPQ